MEDIKEINARLVEYVKEHHNISDAEMAYCWEIMDKYRCPPIESVINKIQNCIEDFVLDNDLEDIEEQLLDAVDVFYEL